MIQQLLKYRFMLWFMVSILQAIFTDIFHDEAYYWLWSKHLAWGYFDHPPMIAWIIRIGTVLGDQEIFVRLVVVLMNLVFVYLLEKLVAPKNLLLFWKIILSVFVLQIGGIIAVPDLPLMFFCYALLLCIKAIFGERFYFTGIAISNCFSRYDLFEIPRGAGVGVFAYGSTPATEKKIVLLVCNICGDFRAAALVLATTTPLGEFSLSFS
jgi:hypothetical protein